jgi:thiamine biosynthesis protein ThiS
MEIFVNGERFDVPSGTKVSDLLTHLKISPDRVAIELNKTLVRKRDWQVTEVANGSCLEVVEFVGGG